MTKIGAYQIEQEKENEIENGNYNSHTDETSTFIVQCPIALLAFHLEIFSFARAHISNVQFLWPSESDIRSFQCRSIKRGKFYRSCNFFLKNVAQNNSATEMLRASRFLFVHQNRLECLMPSNRNRKAIEVACCMTCRGLHEWRHYVECVIWTRS